MEPTDKPETTEPRKVARSVSPWPSSVTELWGMLNRPGHVAPAPLRIGGLVLAMAYLAIAVSRYDETHAEFLWIRLAVAGYGLLGFWVASHITWRSVRIWLVGLALIMPLTAAYVDGLRGNSLPDLTLTALATFVPLVFVHTAVDFLLVIPVLVGGHALVLATIPPPEVPISTAWVLLGGAIATGTMAGVTALFYRCGLNASLVQLQSALRAKSEFVNSMSHELRSPLNVIIGYADMWRDDPGGFDAAYLSSRIRGSAVELLQLVENTMNVARLEAGRVTIRLEEFDPAAVLYELAENVRALPEAQAGVPVYWHAADGLPRVCLDRLKVKEIVQNFVSNALKFTQTGHVHVAFDRDGDQLRILVRDTGPGIAREHQGRIFEVFERVESGGPVRSGVGLGLYIVHSLVRLMHGSITLESEAGQGASFTVRLPLRLDGAAVEGHGAAGALAPSGTLATA